MICRKSCGLALVFLVANIYLTINADKYSITKKYEETLSPMQRERYYKIVNERKMIGLKGYALGFIFSFIVIMMKYLRVGCFSPNRRDFGTMGLICLTAAITFTTQYFFYILSPKSDWMVLHLDTRTQREEWLKVYRAMQFNYHLGLVFGIAAVIVFSYAFCC